MIGQKILYVLCVRQEFFDLMTNKKDTEMGTITIQFKCHPDMAKLLKEFVIKQDLMQIALQKQKSSNYLRGTIISTGTADNLHKERELMDMIRGFEKTGHLYRIN